MQHFTMFSFVVLTAWACSSAGAASVPGITSETENTIDSAPTVTHPRTDHQDALDTVPTLQVSGQARISVPADQALIGFAVETEAKTAAAAAQANAEGMGAVLAALRSADVAEPSIETHGYDLQPQYRRRGDGTEPLVIDGYRATNHIRVTVPDLEDTGAVIDAAVGAGANRVTNLQFTARDLDPARLQALREAVANARAQAETIADAMGIPLGGVLDVSGGASAPAPMELARIQADAFRAVETPIEPGSQVVTAQVTVRYRLGR